MPERKSLMERIGSLEPAPPWGLGAAALTILVAFVAIIAGTAFAIIWFEAQPFSELAGWTFGAVIIVLFVVQTRRRPEDRAALRLGAGGPSLLFVMFLCVGFALLFDLLSLAVTGAFLPVPELLGIHLRAGGLPEWLFAVAFMLVAQPVAEELVFRGVVFPALRGAFGAWIGLVLVAALYAVFHWLAFPPDYANVAGITPIWYGLALPFLDGLVIGAVRAHSGSTRVAIAAHVAFGLFAVIKVLAG
jgi:membrane protease YdiL (CAAX protease family)